MHHPTVISDLLPYSATFPFRFNNGNLDVGFLDITEQKIRI
jgi:hypothetical protein